MLRHCVTSFTPTSMIQSAYVDIEIPKQSIFDFVLSKEQQQNHTTVFIDSADDETLSIAELRRDAVRLACGLRRHCSIGRNSRVLVITPNSLAYPIIFFGISAAGATVSLANPAYGHLELSHQIKDIAADLILAHPTKIDLCERILREMGYSKEEMNSRIVSTTESSHGSHISYTQLLSDDAVHDAVHDVPEKFDGDSAHSVAVVCYSSGTTGASKGVMTTHHNLIASACQLDNTRAYPLQISDTVLSFMPFYHIFGLSSTLINLVKREVRCVLLPRYTLETFAAAIEKYRISVTSVVPPILNAILKSDVDMRFDMRSLRVFGIGAAPFSDELAHAVSEKFGGVVSISNGYGLTETSPLVCKMPLEYAKSHPSWVGKLVCNTVARITDETGQDVRADGELRGELWIKGPQVMRGYLNNTAATAACMTPDGFFKTGDIAIYDSKTRLFKIVDRMKEVIKYKGFQVTPASLEALLVSHPQVNDAAVIGVYDDRQATELPRAYVVPRDEISHDSCNAWCAEIRAWVDERVTSHSRLRGGVRTLEAIPRISSGKVLRRHLRTLAAQQDHAMARL